MQDARQSSIDWLWKQQGEDGGWHSTRHDVLEDGTALTPFILFHLMNALPESTSKHDERVQQGLQFIRSSIEASIQKEHGAALRLEYPNYSAAYALRVFVKNQSDTMLQRLLAEHLIHEQFVEHRGIIKDHLAYGGWGYGESGLAFGSHGHVDISHTRKVVEALTTYMKSNYVSASLRDTFLSISKQKAIIFLQGAQRSPEDQRLYEGCTSRIGIPYDGGFISSTVTMYTNKSVPEEIPGAGIHYPSYATATCDGLLALEALGLQKTQLHDDARGWLEVHQDMSMVEGLSPDDPEQWHKVMHYYHLAVRAESMSAARIDGTWKQQIANLLMDEQLYGGYFVNPLGGPNKEDDPLLATIFAVIAMSVVSGQ